MSKIGFFLKRIYLWKKPFFLHKIDKNCAKMVKNRSVFFSAILRTFIFFAHPIKFSSTPKKHHFFKILILVRFCESSVLEFCVLYRVIAWRGETRSPRMRLFGVFTVTCLLKQAYWCDLFAAMRCAKIAFLWITHRACKRTHVRMLSQCHWCIVDAEFWCVFDMWAIFRENYIRT